METVFTPWMSLAGGALIGLAAVALMALHGRIFGATGILAGALLPSDPQDRGWRLALLAGMISGPVLVWILSGSMPEVQVPVSLPALLIGGVLVGIGVTLGSGCTSGHGVCGMARLSPRSIAATLVFMTTCGVTVFLIRHGIGG
ncbi:YeeE/YedE family protein [Dinoroseobacter sp. S124A]|uniref:YeeE/YedE family protein n=1 Tax=Dinoroseobacter sp. S124A TaxID=3415128 RepID=UPI003C7CB961